MDQILIVDFGSQTTQLIVRRIRELGVYAEVIASESVLEDELPPGVKGLILSGSPYSVYEKEAPGVNPRIYSLGIPILGICYGLQRITTDLQGKISALTHKEYGRSPVTLLSDSPLIRGVPNNFISWMSHGDGITEMPEGFSLVAESARHAAILENQEKRIYGVQFHPEVSHCEQGEVILANFVFNICGASKSWSMERYRENIVDEIRRRVGSEQVLLLISGGVDSTVVGSLLLKALDPGQVHFMYIDTGLMRQGESQEVSGFLKKLGALNIYEINAARLFLSALKGVADPEEKRKIIGDLFIKVQEQEVAKLGIRTALLAQGTLYTDMIESGKGVGKKAHLIKTHHNVRSPLVEEKRARNEIIEPLSKLFKDEVRQLGLSMGIPLRIIQRHPFPGPGLGVRILGEVTREKCEILREADYLYIQELKRRNLYDQIWQAFCVLLPLRSVGVAGDARDYGYVLSLRAVVSQDGMTADVYPFNIQDLLEISALITNTVRPVGRVVYDISGKPPATIEWE